MTKIKIKDFSKSKHSLSLPYLLKLQKDSWEKFWDVKFKDLLKEISPIKDYTGEDFELYFSDYKLGQPKYKTDLEAKKNNDSYDAPLNVKVRLVNLKTKKTKEKEIFLCDFPLQTKRGTFVVNGIERVAVSQLIRSPGAFFFLKKRARGDTFGAKVIPSRGAWVEFQVDSSGVIWVKIDRKRKIAATALLRAFGIEEDLSIQEKFEDVDKGRVKYIEETLKKDATNNRAEALVAIYQRLRPGDMATTKTARELIDKKFSFERYDLSEVGRWRMWSRLPETNPHEDKNAEITLEDRVLSAEDLIAVLREVIRMNNDPNAKEDEIDHLGSRRVRPFTEYLVNRLRIGFVRMERIARDRMSTLDINTLTPQQLINPKPVMSIVKQFFISGQLSQFMDNLNPLAEVEHKRRLSATGPGGLTKERAGFDVRDVQPSHYGRVCPIESPEGGNIGLISHIASFAETNKYGFLETPYFKVKNGKILDEIDYLNAYEEEKFNIGAGSVPTDKNGEINVKELEGRREGEPRIIEKDEVDYFDVSPQQQISIAASLIPFLQADDANRALMGSNMQRQSVPLVNPQPPLVMTGVEKKVAKDSGRVVVSKEKGEIIEVDGKHIKVKGKNTINYELENFIGTNQNTCFHQRPIVKIGQKVEKGEILTDGGSIKDGYLALGRNALVAFMPWRGTNLDDGILVSERLVKDDMFTSTHIEVFGCDVRETKRGPEVTTSDIPNVSERKLKDLDEEGIVRIGAEVTTNDILVGKISPKGKKEATSEENLLKAIFGEKSKAVKDTSLRMEHGKRGRVIGVKVFSRELGDQLDPGVIKRVEVEIAHISKIQVGDKLTGRHGNKGVITKILPREEMPFLEDGTPVDVVLNPLTVVSRMNIGQVLETHLGLAAKKLGYHAVTPALSGANVEDVKKELKKAGFAENGKTTLYDGRTGLPFKKDITIGYMYMLKLEHMIEKKIHTRSIGPYSLITQQPLGGKAQFGGQRVGEMVVWAFEGYGAAHSLQEMLTIKSDDVLGRSAAYESIIKGEEITNPNTPASFRLLVNELKALGLGVEVKKDKDNKNN
jgi:DNA-directed RNA polymerase subunit beta